MGKKPRTYRTKVELNITDPFSGDNYHFAGTIFEEENRPVPTGVLDTNGNELFRVIKKEKIGFI